MSASAREEIMARVRGALRNVPGRRVPPLYEPLAAPGDPTGLATLEQRIASFMAQLEGVGARVRRLARRADAAPALCEIVREIDAKTVALSEAPAGAELLDDCAAALDRLGLSRCSPGERAALLAADVGVSRAQWGVAETGTLVLVSSAERHRLVSLVPPVHVALLDETAILGTLAEALRAAQGSAASSPPAAITFITGPSRTADIELTLVVGVHGPKNLHVLLIPPP